MIPESIVDLINMNLVSVDSGKGTKDEPLMLTVLDLTDVANLKAMIESFKDYNVKVERRQQRSTVSYAITLTNEKEAHYLVMTLSENQNEMINYLDSLIEDTTNPGTGNGGSDTAKPGTDNAELDTTNPGTGNDGLDTTNPETGLQVQWPFMSSGIIVLIVGIWLVLKRKAINK